MMLQPLRAKARARQPIYDSLSRPAPVLGWNARDSEANMKPGYAMYLDNWFPATGSVDVRKGATNHTTGFVAPVKSLQVWSGVTGTEKLFGFTDSGGYECVLGAVGAVSTVLTNGRVQGVSMRTSGNSYLYIVNGVDSARYYDGTTWTITASYAINGGGTLTSSTVSNANVFKRRLFLIPRDSLDFYSLPLDSITGAVDRFPLGAIFGKGGYLVAMGTWTIDSGSGSDDFAVFVTSKGQVAVYQGTDPTSASAWALVGVFDVAPPLGAKCFFKYGGDIVLLTREGAFPLSKAVQSSVLSTKQAITDTISGAFSAAAQAYGGNYGWQAVANFNSDLLLINVPVTEFSTSVQYVMNTITGAWCRFTEWNAFSWALVGNQLYMGMSNKVAKAWDGTNDFGGPIMCYAKAAFDYFGSRAQQKHVKLLRPNLRIEGSVAVDVAVDVNFADSQTYGPASFNPPEGDLWDVGLWDTAVWSDVGRTRLDWLTVSVAPGYCAAPRLRVFSQDATVSWTATDFAFERGGLL